ncbi:MAG: TraM recognition domain-containing protein [Candidatus Nanopelagicales bacterium]
MSSNRRDRPRVSADKDMAILKVIAVVVPASFLPVIAHHLAGEQGGGWNPVGLLLSIGTGKQVWPTAATVFLIVEILFLATTVGVTWWALAHTGRIKKIKERRSDKRLDRVAATMADPRDVEATDPRQLAKVTSRIAPAISRNHPGYLGIPLGRTVNRNRELWMLWEWVCLAIAGARMGKTTALAIPAACYAPGALVATSNKKDLYTHTAYLREQMGSVWLFDLQGVTTGNPREVATFWFNPLRQVTDLPSAKVVCDYFVSAATDENARVDAYFDGAARDLFGSYVLAAAVAGGDMRHVVDWLRETQSQVPVAILDQHGYPDLANAMRGKQRINAKQRDGFYDMARRFLAPLDEPRYAQAVLPNNRVQITVDSDGGVMFTPGPRIHSLPEFDTAAFVRSTDTVYAMSMEGPGSASALTTALIGAIGDTARDFASTQSSGRMPIPMVFVLDEAANICKLQQLPTWYSHFGSRGLILLTILQSPSQAIGVWGKTKFDAMKDACNVVWYGGNVDDDSYVDSLSNAIGDHYVATESRSHNTGIFGGSGDGNVQKSWQKERILDSADLKALPTTRAIITLAGSKPLLVRKNYWDATPFADDIRRSVQACAHSVPALTHKTLLPEAGIHPGARFDSARVTGDDAITGPVPVVAASRQVTESVLDSEFFGGTRR